MSYNLLHIDLRIFFLLLITFTSGAVLLMTTLPIFNGSAMKCLRGTLFIALGFSVSSPLAYAKFFAYTLSLSIVTYHIFSVVSLST